MPISVDVRGVEETTASLEARFERMTLALRAKILSLELQLQSKIQGNLAEGIGLKSRHGTAGLAGSVRAIEPTIDGTDITGTVEGAGGTSWYGAMWEFTGHKEIVPVNKKVLHFFVDGKGVFTTRVSAQGPRPWFLPVFNDMKSEIIASLTETAHKAGE